MKEEILMQEYIRKLTLMKARMLDREKQEKALGIPTSSKITNKFIKEQSEVIKNEYMKKLIDKKLAEALGGR
tara:strand:+ start:106 stop:321 length:216 start_codon:yes stop_codon:yes gene_type:complete